MLLAYRFRLWVEIRREFLLWPPAAHETTFRRSSDRANVRSGLARRLWRRRFLRLAWPRHGLMSASFRWLPGGQARSPCSIFASYWIGHERDTITHDRRQPTRLSPSQGINSRRSISSYGCQSRHFVTAAHEGARLVVTVLSMTTTRVTLQAAFWSKTKIGFVSQNVAAGTHRFCLGDLRRRTPGLPRFSSMHSTPAALKVLHMTCVTRCVRLHGNITETSPILISCALAAFEGVGRVRHRSRR